VNGCSNSRSSPTSETGPATQEVGIDTARLLFRLRDRTEQAHATERFAGSPLKLRFGPEDRARGTMTMGWMPDFEVLWVEGRPIEALIPQSTALLPPAALGDAHELVRRALGDDGWRSVAPMGPSRLDVTATVALSTPSDGWALLRGMGALDVPRRKSVMYTKDGRPQTVAKVTERGSMRERIYDKGAERGDVQPGRLVRFEAQTRYPKVMRTTVEHWTMERVQETFQTRFAPMARAAEGLHVASEQVVREQLRQLAADGKITARMAELLMGHVAARSVGLPQARATYFRRRAELRRLGLALALDGDDQATDVDLPAVLEDVLTCPMWAA
jgi:hypothetical protein